MHELSIAKALMDLADRYLPPDGKVHSLQVKVGPLQAIEEEAMRWAWLAATAETRYDGAVLELEYLSPRRRCQECGAETDGEAFEPCPRCEARFTVPIGGDELLLVSLDVEDPVAPEGADESSSESREPPGLEENPAIGEEPVLNDKEI